MTDYKPWSYDDYVKAGKALIEAEYPELLLTLKERGELVTRQARIIQGQQARIEELEVENAELRVLISRAAGIMKEFKTFSEFYNWRGLSEEGDPE